MNLLLAALDANSWAIIIGALVMGATQLLQIYIAWLRERAKIIREEFIADRVREVAEKQDTAAKAVRTVKDDLHELTEKQNIKLDTVVGDIADVRKNSNGLTERLIAETKAAAFLQGAHEERTRVQAAASDSAIRLELAAAAKLAGQPKTEPDIAQIHE